MMNAFEDVKRELVNGKKFATSYDDFVSKMLDVIQEAMNNTDIGQEVMDNELCLAIRMGLSVEQWNQKKAKMMQLLFFIILDECPMLKKEMAEHLYKSLQTEG